MPNLNESPENARRRKLQTALTALRTQKMPQQGSFLPSQAYAILGHGGEPLKKKFIVPENCIVIVKALPAELMYWKNVYPLFNKLFERNRTSIYENPLCYMSEIINDFGSVNIYRPGDRCPNFRYWLAPTSKELELKNGLIAEDINFVNINSLYGLVPLRSNNPISKRMYPRFTSLDQPAKKLIEQLYEHSIRPTLQDFKDWAEFLAIEDDFYNETSTLKESINAFQEIGQDLPKDIMPDRNVDVELFPNETSVTQYDLFNLNKSTGKVERPGVYYNFVCRLRGKNTHNFYEYNVNQGKGVRKSDILNYRSATKGQQAIMANLILEAEKRKHFLRGTRFNRPATANRRKTRKNRRNKR